MQSIAVQEFTYSKAAQILSTEVSDLRGKLDLAPLMRYEAFEVIGRTKTLRYCFFDVKREGARHEIGDITAWMFRPVDNFGRAVDGPRIMIFND